MGERARDFVVIYSKCENVRLLVSLFAHPLTAFLRGAAANSSQDPGSKTRCSHHTIHCPAVSCIVQPCHALLSHTMHCPLVPCIASVLPVDVSWALRSGTLLLLAKRRGSEDGLLFLGPELLAKVKDS